MIDGIATFFVVVTATGIHAGLYFILVNNLRLLRQTRIDASVDRLTDQPRVSVVIPARNEASNLQRLLPSLLEQTYPDFEVVVLDDASEDATWEVLEGIDDTRLTKLRGAGPPPGWVGKVHALYEATRHTSGELLLFLDADAEFLHDKALDVIVASYLAAGRESVLTAVTRLRGGGHVLVSMVTHAMLAAVPWFALKKLRPAFSALNGQCWMVDAQVYAETEPHLAHKNEVLEDVRIGRYLAAQGHHPVLVDLQREIAIHMYVDTVDAWRGFRKNAYLIMGGTISGFFASLVAYWLAYIVGPATSIWLLASLFVLKAWTDRRTGFNPAISLLAPVSFLLGAVMQFDSAIAHWRGRVTWKARQVGDSTEIRK